ncbi:HlyC/CorC family transporter [Anaeromicropila populeti]|uniref:Hemolysin, contains CBS domains n=1 Tax=Anaeromicropila populeti TaxID=37658 RepID=A0A1I6JDH4_9FIRM|nr:Hemolysin, contains CBS domains [Anaeromicropila populeti]
MDPSDVTQLIILIVLLLLSAFFSSAETALTTVNKIRIRSLVEKNVKGAKTVSNLIEDPTKLLSAILIGNNIVNISASSIATTFAISLCKNFGLAENASLGVGISTGVLTILILIFGEITPKSVATIYAEKLSLSYSAIIYLITQILTPFIFIINKLSLAILLLLRIDPNYRGHVITENELRTIVNVSHEEGVLESEERKMITNVVDFGDSIAKDVMVPRIDMEFVDINYSYSELVEVFSKDKFSRMPVYEGSRDNVVGIINLKDVFFYQGSTENFNMRELLREPYFTYEFKKTPELLIELRKASRSIAIVLDEYGATAGLITLEDLLEEIVGEIRDEYDSDEEDSIQKIGENEYLVNGSTKLFDINEILELSLESDDYDSIAGHIINLLDHLPEEGETVTDNNVVYTVRSVDKNRIDKIHILILPKEDDVEDN